MGKRSRGAASVAPSWGRADERHGGGCVSDAALGDLPVSVRDQLAKLPPTASLVYLELAAAAGPRTVRQLSYEMVRPERSILRALRQLHDEDLVTCSPRHTDPPSSEWSINE